MRVQDTNRILSLHFKEAWVDETPIYSRNDIPTKPKEGKNGGWVLWETNISSMWPSSFGDVGNRGFSRHGRIYVQIFVQTSTRTERLDELIGKVVDIYEGNRIDAARIRAVTTRSVPSDGKWIGCVVTAQYSFDEIK